MFWRIFLAAIVAVLFFQAVNKGALNLNGVSFLKGGQLAGVGALPDSSSVPNPSGLAEFINHTRQVWNTAEAQAAQNRNQPKDSL